MLMCRPTHVTLCVLGQVQSLLENMQQRFQTMSDNIISRIDEMGDRIDELEKSVADVMTQAQAVDDGDK